MLVIVFISSVAVFYAIRLSGGDAISSIVQPGSSTLEAREQLRELWGLNLPIHEQYLKYMGDLLRGEPGLSIVNSSPISEMFRIHGRNSLVLGVTAFALVGSSGAVSRLALAPSSSSRFRRAS